MRWPDTLLDLEDAWLDLRSKPYRSFLSSLGIGVGVMALVAMLSITSGAKRVALESATSLGLDTVRIESTSDTRPIWVSTAQTLTQHTGKRAEIGYFRKIANIAVRHVDTELQTHAIDVSSNFFAAERLAAQSGLLWTPNTLNAPICALGAQLALRLRAAPGDVLIVDDVPCKVGAILRSRSSLLTNGTALTAIDFNNSVFRSWEQRYGADAHAVVTGIVARIATSAEFAAVTALLRFQVRAQPESAEAWQIVVPRELAEQVDATQQLFSWIMSAIAALALLVGGIGIANSLLATIAEQTREIGLRIALGAHESRVLALYLLHALLLCLIGASLGAVLGVLAALLVAALAGWPVTLSVSAVAVGLGFAVLTGALAAGYPALRASGMTPAEALVEH